MKFLLKLLVALASLIGIVLVIAFFVDRSFEVNKSATIPANRQVTFAYFKNLEHQEDFNIWLNSSSETEIWYEGTPGEIGYKMCWKSADRRVGSGEQKIVEIEENERIAYEIKIKEPEAINADLLVKVEDDGINRSKVIWSMTGEIPYPWNLSLLFNDVEEQIALGFEKGLKNARPLIGKTLP